MIVSGDGGWASLDRDIGEALAAKGIPVVGLNSLRYFWRARTPDEAGRDLARILRHYLDAWKARDVVLVGYSLGAEVLPFMASRLPPDLRSRVRLVALLAPGRTASFEFHVSEWLRPVRGRSPTAPEIERLSRAARSLPAMYGAQGFRLPHGPPWPGRGGAGARRPSLRRLVCESDRAHSQAMRRLSRR